MTAGVGVAVGAGVGALPPTVNVAEAELPEEKSAPALLRYTTPAGPLMSMEAPCQPSPKESVILSVCVPSGRHIDIEYSRLFPYVSPAVGPANAVPSTSHEISTPHCLVVRVSSQLVHGGAGVGVEVGAEVGVTVGAAGPQMERDGTCEQSQSLWCETFA